MTTEVLPKRLWLIQLFDRNNIPTTQIKQHPSGIWEWRHWNTESLNFGFAHSPDELSDGDRVAALLESYPHRHELYYEYTTAAQLLIVEEEFPTMVFQYLEIDDLPEDYDDPEPGWYYYDTESDYQPIGPFANQTKAMLNVYATSTFAYDSALYELRTR